MMRYWWLALRSVLRAPGVIEHSLPTLLTPAHERHPRVAASVAEHVVRRSHGILARLGRFPRLSDSRWQATCLYRSVAECLVLRELGYPARVLIGARSDMTTNTIAAHAWVECEGITPASTRGVERYEVLSAPGAVSAVL